MKFCGVSVCAKLGLKNGKFSNVYGSATCKYLGILPLDRIRNVNNNDRTLTIQRRKPRRAGPGIFFFPGLRCELRQRLVQVPINMTSLMITVRLKAKKRTQPEVKE